MRSIRYLCLVLLVGAIEACSDDGAKPTTGTGNDAATSDATVNEAATKDVTAADAVLADVVTGDATTNDATTNNPNGDSGVLPDAADAAGDSASTQKDAGAADGGQDAGDAGTAEAATYVCQAATVADSAQTIQVPHVTGTAPTPEGGQLVAGTYHLIERTIYNATGPDTTRETLLLSGPNSSGIWQVNTFQVADNDPEAREALWLTVSGGILHVSECAGGSAGDIPYTAKSSDAGVPRLVLFVPKYSGTSVLVFEKK